LSSYVSIFCNVTKNNLVVFTDDWSHCCLPVFKNQDAQRKKVTALENEISTLFLNVGNELPIGAAQYLRRQEIFSNSFLIPE
jgi:hypothetical protein